MGNSRHDPFYRTETSRMTANLTKHALMDLASTMSDGKEFQTLATLLEKKSVASWYHIEHLSIFYHDLWLHMRGKQSEKIIDVKVTVYHSS